MKFFIVILLALIGFSFNNTKPINGININRDTVPTGAAPQLFGSKLYEFKNYVLTDSFLMVMGGDTFAIPRWPGLKYKNSDNRWYGYHGTRWRALLNGTDTISLSNRIDAGTTPTGAFISNDSVWKRQGIILYPSLSEQDFAEPTVLYDSLAQVLAVPSTQKIFKMWYTSGWGIPQIDYAESVDGRQWVKYSGNPVIYNHCREAIIKDGSNYYIYADSSITGQIVNRFVSTDGINWTKDHGNMITPGSTGSWNATFGNIWVHKDGSQWRMLIDGLCDTLAYTLGLYTSTDGFTWTPYANNPVIRTISAPWFVKKGTRYWLWGHHVGNREYTPNDIYSAYSDDSLKTWHMAPFGAAYSRLTHDEGVDSVGGGVGDVCLVEARDSVYLFHAAATDALHASGESHFKLAISSLSFDSLVNSFQNMPPGNNQRWISQNNKMYYNLGPVGIGTAIPRGSLDILENVNTVTPATVDAMNHISTRNNLAMFGYNAQYYNGRYYRVVPGETGMTLSAHYNALIADKFTDVNSPQTPVHLGGWLYTDGIFYNQGHVLIGTDTDNGLGSVLQTNGHVEFGGNVRSAGTYNGIQVNKGAGSPTTSIAIANGSSALISNTTGDHNSAFGSNCLSSNTTGTGNTGIGAYALTLNTTGSYNSAVGQLSMQSLTTGNYNAGIGRAVWNNTTTGSGNAGIGTLAGTAITSGDNNVAIGYSAFYTDGTTASSNVSGSAAIGYNAQVTQASSGVLGGLDANGFGMRWGIGVTAPGAWLHLPAGKTTAGFAPLIFTNGEPTTTPAAGQFMYKNGLFIIDSSASKRDTIATRSWVLNNVSGSDGNGIYGGDGTLPSNVTVSTGGNTLAVSGSNDSETSFSVTNTGTTNASAIAGTASGTTSIGVTGTSSQYIGVFGTSTSNTGVQGQSSSGVGVIGVSSTGAGLRAQNNPSSTNAIENAVTILRTSSSGAGANGIGAAIQYELETATSGNSQTAGSLAFQWTDATAATRTSQFEIYAVNGATTARKAALAGNGQWTWDGYGAGTHTGTPTGSLQVTSGGSVIEGPALAAGTYTPTLTNGTNVSSSTASSCQYMRVGNTVTVSGKVNVSPTTIGATLLGISLPIASSIANDNECGGTGTVGNTTDLFGSIRGDATNDRAELFFTIGVTGTTSAQDWYFTFTYRIL